MAVNISDLISSPSNGARPVSTTVTIGRSVSGASLSCGDLTGWDTTTPQHFITYKIDGTGKIVPGSQSDWKGIVSGTTINNLTLTGGTDNGNSVNDIVEAIPTARYGKDLSDALSVAHNPDGSLKPVSNAGMVDGFNASSTQTANTILPLNSSGLFPLSVLAGAAGVTSYTSTGTVGGTGYYVNLGGIKICWGVSASQPSSNPGLAYTLILPSGFFTTVQSLNLTAVGITGQSNQFIDHTGPLSAGISSIYFCSPSGAGTAQVSWMVIGT